MGSTSFFLENPVRDNYFGMVPVIMSQRLYVTFMKGPSPPPGTMEVRQDELITTLPLLG